MMFPSETHHRSFPNPRLLPVSSPHFLNQARNEQCIRKSVRGNMMKVLETVATAEAIDEATKTGE